MMTRVVPRATILPRFLAVSALLLAACAAPPTRVDNGGTDGFALYRSGRISEEQLAELCRLGVEELVVLDGGASGRECVMRSRVCPDLRVRYDTAQDPRFPLTARFLTSFDAWIEESRAAGRKVAFRCRHGWHRTGRLAAWYQMRFEAATAEAAAAEMQRIGRMMDRHPQLVPQVHAMADLLAGRPCLAAPEHCVGGNDRPNGGRAFEADVCPE